MLSLAYLIASYGYIVLLLGTLFEGDTFLIVAGFFAHQRLLSLSFVIIIAWAAAIISDQLIFGLARLNGRKILERFPWLARKVHNMEPFLDSYHSLFVFVYRFLYGFRLPSLVLLGTSRIKASRFVMLNVIGTFIWATTFAMIGYLFGTTVILFFGRVRRVEHIIAFLAIMIVCSYVIFHVIKRRIEFGRVKII